MGVSWRERRRSAFGTIKGDGRGAPQGGWASEIYRLSRSRPRLLDGDLQQPRSLRMAAIAEPERKGIVPGPWPKALLLLHDPVIAGGLHSAGEGGITGRKKNPSLRCGLAGAICCSNGVTV